MDEFLVTLTTLDIMDVESWLKAGRFLATPPEGEDIVITGISGCFPESNNMYEFRDNLSKKADMVTYDIRRWDAVHPEIPKRAGKIWNVEKFDAGFFGVHQHQCQAVDPLCRILMEKCFESILDAGINPKELEGSKTGIFVGACASESEKYWLYDNPESGAYAITGCHRSMLASRIAYALKLQGPAFVMDTACSSSFFAFEHAYRAIREGRCDRAVVAGTNLCLHPYVTLQFSRLGVLSLDGACKCFDDSANGYTRSEAICALVLQKSRDARRLYAHVIHSKINADGYKEEGITYPSGETQKKLISEVYLECQMHPNEISFMEAHGTGTRVGDPEELKAIDDIFLVDRKRPLLIGSVKSNIGHTEPTSGLCSISKVILSMEGGKILPNMNYQTPRRGIKALIDGRLKVVTENCSWPDDEGIVGINSFGFGGANCHTILKWHTKTKTPSKELKIPLLVCVSARTSEATQNLLQNLGNSWMDFEYVHLFHEIFRLDISGHNYRGFLMIDPKKTDDKIQEVQWLGIDISNIVFYFGGPSGNLPSKEMLQIPQFQTSINRSHEILLNQGINLKEILNSNDESDLKTFCYQIAIIDTFKDLGISVNQYFGTSIGKLTCTYLDGQITIEKALQLAIFGLPEIEDPEVTLPKNSVVIQIGNGLISNGNSKNVIKINNLLEFFFALGKIYLNGQSLDLKKLYPEVNVPVSRGTPMISPLIKWDHSRNWFVTKYRAQDIIKTGFVYIALDLKDDYWKFLSGHIADGRNLFPATGYLVLAWDVLGMITGKMPGNMKVIFENVKFLRATNIPTKGSLFLTVMVQRGTGNFEIDEGGVAIVTGTIREFDSKDYQKLMLSNPSESSIKLSQKDIYTELKLRGYNYRGAFKCLKDVDVSCSSGWIEWSSNWVTFLDNMLQMQILQYDTRSLYVPTGIKTIYVDAPFHSKLGDEQKEISVYAHKDLDLIRSGGIEMRGIHANVINRKKVPTPVVEKYVFVPNEAQLELDVSLRIIMQMALENNFQGKLKIVEIFTENQEVSEFLSPLIRTSLEDLPLIEADLRLLTSSTSLDIPANSRITIEDKDIGQETDCYLIISNEFNILHIGSGKLQKSLKPSGYLLVKSTNKVQTLEGFTIFARHETPKGIITLYAREKSNLSEVYLKYDEDGTCLTQIQSLTQKNKDQVVILHTSNPENGLLGFTNCLRKETNSSSTRCIITDDETNLNDPLIKEQLSKGMAININQNGIWGTYRHLLLEDTKKIQAHHAYVNVTTRGDLSSLSWIQGPITHTDTNLVRVHYGAVNFRDVMTATGRVSVDAITNDRLEQECVQGFEYSGVDSKGRRVLGMLTSGALSSLLAPDPDMLLEVPNNWSLEDAVTVPVVYGTVLYAFFMRAGGLRPELKVLIHSGSGGVGQAAIAIALFFGCEVFVTVGSPEKREYLLGKFPKLKNANIGHSRDSTFETLVLKRTQKKGVDIVLNSLAEEKLQASLRCLKDNGCFLEIGKFDLSLDNELQMELFQRGISFHGIMLDGLFKTPPAIKRDLMNMIQLGIEKGAILPLQRTVFEKDDLEKAFRYMSTGKHIGKVVIRVRPNEKKSEVLEMFEAIPKYFCPNGKSCLVIGGLGGFGLELCDWLILRGCKELFITSRNGPRTGYQHLRLTTWRNYGATVKIIKENLYSIESCTKVLEMVPNLDALFNLAAVLHDDLLENQTVPHLIEVLNAKATTTKNLDQLTRSLCPNLRHFVVFSSVSCGRGNICQVNYGMANSIMERVMEQRKKDKLPALAIQWGSIADVGLAAELINDDLNERPIGGTLPQRISNCLELMDSFMAQDETIVASMVVAEKRGGLLFGGNMVETVVNILGVRDLKTVSLHSTLPELGMDSMMAVEIKQTLEREYEIFLTPNDIRTLTFARLQELQGDKNLDQPVGKNKVLEKKDNINFLLRFINDEECSKLSIVPMKSHGTGTKAFVIPGVEGFASILDTLSSKLEFQVFGLQFIFDNPPDTLQEMAELLVPYILPHLSSEEPFNLIAYSFGCTVAIELAILLEQEFGYKGNLILIDGAHEMMLKLTHQQTNVKSVPEFETSIICNIFTIYIPLDLVDSYRNDLLLMKNFEERLEFMQSKTPESQYSREYIKKVSIAFYKRVKGVLEYKRTNYRLKSDIHLLKPSRQSVVDIAEDYNLGIFCQNRIRVKVFEGDHYSILDSDQIAQEINNLVLKKVQHSGKLPGKESLTDSEKIKMLNDEKLKIR